MRVLITFAAALTLLTVSAPPAEAGCGILRVFGRVVGVERRQARWANRQANGGGLFRGDCGLFGCH